MQVRELEQGEAEDVLAEARGRLKAQQQSLAQDFKSLATIGNSKVMSTKYRSVGGNAHEMIGNSKVRAAAERPLLAKQVDLTPACLPADCAIIRDFTRRDGTLLPWNETQLSGYFRAILGLF